MLVLGEESEEGTQHHRRGGHCDDCDAGNIVMCLFSIRMTPKVPRCLLSCLGDGESSCAGSAPNHCAFRAQCTAGRLEAAGLLINKLWPTTSPCVFGLGWLKSWPITSLDTSCHLLRSEGVLFSPTSVLFCFLSPSSLFSHPSFLIPRRFI